MKVQLEIAAAGTDIWQAVDAPTPVEETVATDWNRPGEIADAVADHYASQQAYDDAAPGTQVRAAVTVVHNEGEIDETVETLAVSDVYVVTEPPKPVGRPTVGGVISTAIGAERLAQVDAQAKRYGVKRAEAIRRLLDIALVLEADEGDGPAQPATVAVTAKLYSVSMATVGSVVSYKVDGPYRQVTDVERFGDIYRIWLAPVPGDDGAPEHLDAQIGDSLWQPHTDAPDEIDEAQAARDSEALLEAAAAEHDGPDAEMDPAELAHLRELGLA